MTTEVDNQLVADLARETLAEVAPSELESFPAISKAFFRNPEKVLEKADLDKPGGTGTVVGDVILLPVLLWLGMKLVDLAWKLIVEKPIEDELSLPISRFIKRWLIKFGLVKPAKPKTLAEFTLVDIQAAYEELLIHPDLRKLASRYNLSNEQVKQFLNIIMSNLENKLPKKS